MDDTEKNQGIPGNWREYRHRSRRGNAVCPGVIHTAMIDRFTGGDKKAMEQMTALEPIGRMGTPEEIANAVIWLCSDDASFVTGHPLVVDGGFVARESEMPDLNREKSGGKLKGI